MPFTAKSMRDRLALCEKGARGAELWFTSMRGDLMVRVLPLLLLTAFLTGCTKPKVTDPNQKILIVPTSADIKTLDPGVAADGPSVSVIVLNQESLFQYSYLKKPLELEPLLADGMPKVSADKKIFTIKIKKGVVWQDDPAFPGGKGRELVADDFIYGWKRMLVPQIQSPGTWIFEDKVLGYSELKHAILTDKGKSIEEHLNTPIAGFKAIDPYTIQIKVNKAYPQLPDVLTEASAAPVAKEVTAKYGHEGLSDRMVGTGPFILKQIVRSSHVELIKNPNFRRESYPLIDGITFIVFKEEQPQWLQFMRGNIDISGIPKDNFESATENGELTTELAARKIQLQKENMARVWWLAFNMKDKLLGKNVYLRRAIASAINREEFIQLFLNGRGIKATSIVPPSIQGFTGRRETDGDFNLAEAKKLLAKAGYPNGRGLPTIKFDVRGASSTSRQQAEWIRKSLAKIGVNIEVVVNTFPAYLDKAKTGNLQFFIDGWQTDYADAENFLQLLMSKNASGGTNSANWVNSEYDQLFEKISAMSPSQKRLELIKKAEDIVFKEMPWSMLYYSVGYYLNHGWVTNYRPSSIIMNHLKYVDLDMSQKKELMRRF